MFGDSLSAFFLQFDLESMIQSGMDLFSCVMFLFCFFNFSVLPLLLFLPSNKSRNRLPRKFSIISHIIHYSAESILYFFLQLYD